jgi:hypothetical protein
MWMEVAMSIVLERDGDRIKTRAGMWIDAIYPDEWSIATDMSSPAMRCVSIYSFRWFMDTLTRPRLSVMSNEGSIIRP